MTGTSHRLWLAVAGLLSSALLALGGASSVAAITVHPCLPGETDVIGGYPVHTGEGHPVVEVWECIDVGPDVPTPDLPWGSLADGVPCPAGPGVSKVRLEIDGVMSTVWICSTDLPPPPPGSKPATRSSMPAPTRFVPIGASTKFEPMTPTRTVDTRQPGDQMLTAGETRRVDLSSVLGDTMTGAAVNVTAVNAQAAGYLTAWDCNGPPPGTSTVNFRAGGTSAASTVVVVDAGDEFCVFTSAAAHLIVDVNGGYSPAGGFGFTTVTPRRVHDSRPVQVPAESVTVVQFGVSSPTPRAAFLNVTAVSPAAAGYLTVWPCSIPRPEVSNLNFPSGISAIANAVQVPVDADGSVCVYNSATTGVLVDLFGVYDDSPTGRRYQATNPIRLMDTRDGTGGWIGTIGNGQLLDVRTPMPTGPGLLGTVTLVDPPQAGFLTVAAKNPGLAALAYSTLNMIDTTIANMFIAEPTGTLYPLAGPTGGEHVIIDLTGYFVAP